jgi:signal transduction histidine kinase
VTVRLGYGGKVYGLLSVSIPRDLAADEEEQGLFEEVAGDIAFALHNMELEEKHRAADEALQQREAVLGAMALAAEKFLRPSDWEQNMQAALAYLGKAADVSRAIIWEASTSDAGKYLLSACYEWIAPEAKLAPQVGLQRIPVFRRWRDLLPRGEIVAGHVRDFSAKEQEFFVPRGIKSVLVVPIFVNDAWWGFMGFDQGGIEREWTEAEIDTLKTAASILSGALERRRADEALEEYSERLEEMVEERTKELREAQEQLVRREKLAVLGQLAGGVGHELRNPLGAIKNAAYFLNMVLEEPDPEVKETLEILEKEVATSERTISSLLDFARTKSPVWRKVHLKEVVQEALSRAPVPENVEVVSQLDGRLPIILADPDQLSQVFGNIVLNAVQAMPDGGQLIVESQVPSPEWVAVSFADTGVGIPEEHLDKLFEPLFTTKAKGIGLGMAVTKTLVEGHGGKIEVESEVGKGSTFTVRLPISVG